MKLFQVLKPGLFTTVQDAGRYGHLRYGVPVSGAMDTFSLVAANLLVGNSEGSACLETTLVGPELQVPSSTQIAITGGACSPQVNGQIVPAWQTLTVQKGDTISFGKMESGCRAYIAARGGIDSPLVLGSRSTYVRGGFGGVGGRSLKAGDVVDGFVAPQFEVARSMPTELVPQFTNPHVVHVVLGPQTDMFTDKGVETFLSSQYRITVESDRMGYRLEGPVIEHKEKADIVSDALLPGAVQVPKNGRPIVIMRDAQTTGGYTKIAVAVTSDVDVLGQAKPNDTIEFCKVSVQQAQIMASEYRRRLTSLGRMLSRL